MTAKLLKYPICALPFFVLGLIFFGALVTSHGAGLSVPDWPTTFGHNMFTYPVHKWQGGVLYEHGHRLIASGIGAVTLLIAVMVWRRERRRPVRILSALALITVIVQGVLGGVTVLLKLPDAVSVAHALLGQTFLLITIALAYCFKVAPAAGLKWRWSPFNRMAVLLLLVLYLQLLAGALMRHAEAGLAVPDFPTMAGSLWPSVSTAAIVKLNVLREQIGLGPVTVYQVTTHLIHRCGALLVLSLMFAFFIRAYRAGLSSRQLQLVRLLLPVTAIQILLGVFTILSLKSAYLTSLHVVTGAGLLGLVWLITLSLAVLPEPAVKE
jgi:cytochrome c oxidase assembly protein subunit 15